MFKFFLKKNFADGWDNMFFLLLTNLLSVALMVGGWLLLSATSSLHPAAPTAVLVALSAALSTVAFAHGAVAAKIANFESGSFGTFFRAFTYVWRVSVPFGALLALFLLSVRFGIVYYLGVGGTLGILAVGLIGWSSLAVVVALQWFLPFHFLQSGNGFVKCLRKSFVIFFDNPMFSIGVFVHNAALLALSCGLFMLVPGFAGLALSSVNALRLRLYKYDWLEEMERKEPGFSRDRDRRADVPWDDLLADDVETLGPRKLSSFVFPWK